MSARHPGHDHAITDVRAVAGVDVVSGGTSHLVGVTTGLYSNTLVQVSAPGLTAGTRVEVPAS